MPDLGTVLATSSTSQGEAPAKEQNGVLLRLQMSLQAVEEKDEGSGVVIVGKERRGGKKAVVCKSLEEHVADWVERKVRAGVPEWECSLPFLCNAPKMVECHICRKFIHPVERINCSVRDCQAVFHKKCAKQENGFSSSTRFKCPQHVCFVCKQKGMWRCVICTMAAHTKCSPWPSKVMQLSSQHKEAICWKHPKDWHHGKEHTIPTGDMEEVFHRLPLPYFCEEFSVNYLPKNDMQSTSEPSPAPYVHIRRNIYLIKKKRDAVNVIGGCTSCNFRSICGDDCECRGQSVSCSKACNCSELCTNRPFRKEKRIKVVKTQYCGWGVEALEDIDKGDFIIEYIGEVIDDAQCEQRLWDMKYRGDQNFYMCEIRKDFTIDATFKGNASRFLNHSCEPNCKLEKWHVEGETRVGVFAYKSIVAGEPLTYDYRFEHFGPMVKCNCGASNCQGYIGSKKKIHKEVLTFWGCKRKRTMVKCLQNEFSIHGKHGGGSILPMMQ